MAGSAEKYLRCSGKLPRRLRQVYSGPVCTLFQPTGQPVQAFLPVVLAVVCACRLEHECWRGERRRAAQREEAAWPG